MYSRFGRTIVIAEHGKPFPFFGEPGAELARRARRLLATGIPAMASIFFSHVRADVHDAVERLIGMGVEVISLVDGAGREPGFQMFLEIVFCSTPSRRRPRPRGRWPGGRTSSSPAADG